MRILIGSILILLVGAVQASRPVDLEANPSQDQFSEIRSELQKETYAEISADDRRTVLGILDRMEASLTRSGGIDSMSEQQKATLFNDQERVNAILTEAAADSRLVCRREQATGSHRKTTVCITAAERRRVREGNQDQLRKVSGQALRVPGDF